MTRVAFPDSLVGTDSHTTMINGLGVLGWGVGGIEAEAVMLGQPIHMLTPEVVGVRLTGGCPRRYATDPVLRITEMLRKKGSSASSSNISPRPRQHDPGRSGNHRQYVPRIWRDSGLLPPSMMRP